MNHTLHFDQLVEPLIKLLDQFLHGGMAQTKFQLQFKTALEEYESKVGSRGYSPLAVVANPEEHHLPHYLKYCKEALERLPKEALDRSTRHWVEQTLVEDDGRFSYFRFTDPAGVSLFGSCQLLYSTPIDGMSFLLSEMNGTIVRSNFAYQKLLEALRNCLLYTSPSPRDS